MERLRADEMAAAGYVALAIDMYGKGNRPSNIDEARELMNHLKEVRTNGALVCAEQPAPLFYRLSHCPSIPRFSLKLTAQTQQDPQIY